MILTPEKAVVASIIICLAGALLTLLVARSKVFAGWLAFVFTACTSGLIFWAVAHVLRFGPSARAAEFWAMPKVGFALRLYVDGLTSIFLTVAALVALPAAFYSITYMRHYKEYGVARYYPYFLLFLAAMYGLLSTTDMMWFFFIFWQMMTWAGYALIRYEWKKRENVRASNKYLIMMQVACAATMIGAELLAIAGVNVTHNVSLKYDFDTVSSKLPTLLVTEPGAVALAFFFFLVGFGIKMGMWPFGQVWLPDAHPAAPSPVSAMLSGVMIKTGAYGVIRYFLWLVPASAAADYPLRRWGLLVCILATITLFTGTMNAMRQEQSKRLLAFSSIGQIGYVLFGIGVCMALLGAGTPAATALATVALTGALFHVVNHGMMKGLLFLNAGSMLYSTGTQDLNKMGGLMKYMPLTGLTALIASFSISGVPLSNGFASKWTMFVAAIQGSASARYLGVCAVIAILTSALTLAALLKFFGVSFLSRTSSLVNEQVAKKQRLEVGVMMQLPQVLLALFCVVLGLMPIIGLRFVQMALDRSRQGFGETLAKTPHQFSLPGLQYFGVNAIYSPLIVAAVLALMFLLTYGISKLGRASRRASAPWLCGYAREAECHRYVARNFYGEITRYFRWIGGAPRRQQAGTTEPVLKER